ncbi:hypothetical protein [Altererythrobacter lauratis]|uniref:Uncharacterized protein n=1 Tax=Alteraurantiacibacter lauratis TaxID=2054627 RepID=A0ABV7EFE2_9SPHN
MKSFSEFVRSPRYRERWQPLGEKGAEFHARLSRADIRSLRALQGWVRERYPDLYKKPRTFLNEHTGREIVANMWADYLRWAEGGR